MTNPRPHVMLPLLRQVARSYGQGASNRNTNLICITQDYPTPASNPKVSLHLDLTSASAPKSKKSAKKEPYSVQRAQELFSTYADSDDASVIGPEGFEQLCSDAAIPMDGSCPLILAWLMQAKEMGKISKEEWAHGTSVLKCVSPLTCTCSRSTAFHAF